MRISPLRAINSFKLRLRDDCRGLALIEFAYAMPVVFAVGMYGIEVSNLAQTNLRVSQIALTLADNASRVGVSSDLSVQQLREVDINDILQGVRLQSEGLDLLANGRITLSSLEQNAQGGQWIRWQRCIGLKQGAEYDSHYGKTDDGKTGTTFLGMGETGAKAIAPPNSAVMFVEINYDHQPLFSNDLLGGPSRIRYTASFIARDRRDLTGTTGLFNPAPVAPQATCDKYTA